MNWALVLLFAAVQAADPCEHARLELASLGRQHFVDPTEETRSLLTPQAALVLDSAARGAIAGDESLSACLPGLAAQARWISDPRRVIEPALTSLRGAKPVPFNYRALEQALTETPRSTTATPSIEDLRPVTVGCLDASAECSRREFDLLRAALSSERDPRRWAPETVAAFILASRAMIRTTSDKKGVAYDAIGSLGRMGYKRALGLLIPQHPALALPGPPDSVGGPKLAHVQDPWRHFAYEEALNFSEWTAQTKYWPITMLSHAERGKRTEELEAHMIGRWDDLDARAPSPDLVQIIKLIEAAERKRDRRENK